MIHFSYLPDWRWLAGAGALAALILLGSYWVAVGRPKWSLRIFLLILRWLAIASVLVCLLDPQRVEEIRRQQTTRVAVLVDTSRSMSLKDMPDGRLGAVKSWVHQQLLPACPAGVTRSFYTFSQSLELLPQLDTA